MNINTRCIHINAHGEICGKRCYKHGNVCSMHYRGIKSEGRGFIHFCIYCDNRTKSKYSICKKCDIIFHCSVSRQRGLRFIF